MPKKICRRFEQHCAAAALARARFKAGSNIAAKMPMIAITTSNSISVNALRFNVMLLIAYQYPTVSQTSAPVEIFGVLEDAKCSKWGSLFRRRSGSLAWHVSLEVAARCA